MKRYVFPIMFLAATMAVTGCAAKKDSPQTKAQSTAPTQGAPGVAGGRGGFTQFRESHKYTFMLTRMMANIGRLEAEGNAPLTKQQAKTILAVVEPLRKKPTLTQDEAKQTATKVKAVLTAKQLTEMGKMKQPERRGGQGQGMGQGRGMGMGQGMGQGQNGQRSRMNFDPIAMKNFNPFNASGNNPMAARSAKRMNEMFDALKLKANSKQSTTQSTKGHK